MSLLPLIVNSGEFYHFGTTVLREIVWMTLPEYKRSSLARRASYSYLNALVDGAFRSTERLLKAAGESAQKSYRARFLQAEEHGALPISVGTRLAELAVLRNRTTHETTEVNERLEVFPFLLEMSVIALAMSEVEAARVNHSARRVFIDAARVLWLAQSSHDPLLRSQLDSLEQKAAAYSGWMDTEFVPPGLKSDA